MKNLKALVGQKKKEFHSIAGDAKWVKRAEIVPDVLPFEEVGEKKRKLEEQALLKTAELLTNKKPRRQTTSSSDGTVSPIRRISKTTSDAFEETDETVCRKLRNLGRPWKLFGETDEQRLKRLHDVDSGLASPNISSVLEVPGKTALVSTSNNSSRDEQIHRKIEKFFEQVTAQSIKELGAHFDDDNLEFLLPVASAEKIRGFICHMMAKWRAALDSRTDAEKLSFSGKRDFQIYQHTQRDLKPLLKHLKEERLEEDILTSLADIVNFCASREYVKAHDKYIELAIGNAAWPMGVTMVGIHERVGRSKIFSKEIAHILNDETTRKYIQMIKRLMSLAQEYYPTDPSKMVTIATKPGKIGREAVNKEYNNMTLGDLSKCSDDLLNKGFVHDKPWIIDLRHKGANPQFSQSAALNTTGNMSAAVNTKFGWKGASVTTTAGLDTSLGAQLVYPLKQFPGLTISAKTQRKLGWWKAAPAYVELASDIKCNTVHLQGSYNPFTNTWKTSGIGKYESVAELNMGYEVSGKRLEDAKITVGAELKKVHLEGGMWQTAVKFMTTQKVGLDRLVWTCYNQGSKDSPSELAAEYTHIIADNKSLLSIGACWYFNSSKDAYIKAKLDHEGKVSAVFGQKVSDSVSLVIGGQLDVTKSIVPGEGLPVKCGLRLNLIA